MTDAKGREEQDQPRDSPPAMLMKVQIPNHSSPTSGNQEKPMWAGSGSSKPHILTSLLHPRQSGPLTLNRPTVKFISFHGFMIDKKPSLQEPPGQCVAVGLLLTHSPGFSCSFCFKNKTRKKKITHDFNAVLKEKGVRQSLGSVPTTSF